MQLTDIFISRRRDDQRSSAGLLRDSVVVALPKEVETVLDPSVPIKQTSDVNDCGKRADDKKLGIESSL